MYDHEPCLLKRDPDFSLRIDPERKSNIGVLAPLSGIILHFRLHLVYSVRETGLLRVRPFFHFLPVKTAI